MMRHVHSWLPMRIDQSLMRPMIWYAIQMLCVGSLCAAPVSTEVLRVQFTRSLYAPASPPEIVKGNIYYSAEGKIFLEVTSPVSQLITLTGTQMNIYYPIERKAFVFESKNPLLLPFASVFLSSIKESMGLPELGFTASSVAQKGDTILSAWTPPAAGRSVVGRIELAEHAGVVVRTESFDPKGKLATQSVFKNYVTIRQGRVPLEVYSGWQTSKGWTRENLEFANPTSIADLPRHLNGFVIPSDVVPRKVQW